jgi:hypothetical protein
MIKCPYCGNEFDVQAMPTSAAHAQAEAKTKWYFSTYWFVIALLCIGPFALPLMWFNPRYKLITKIIVSVLVIVVSIWLYKVTMSAYNTAMQQLKALDLG